MFPGAPDTTNGPAFPWLTLLNRPLNGPLEILSVPRTSQSRLLEKAVFRVDQTGTYSTQQHPIGHLMNYWHTHSPASPGTAGEDSLNLHRVFEYLTVPSRFVDSRVLLNFNDTKYTPATGGMSGTPASGLSPNYQLNPPFNWVSTFRDPGKPNINTIASKTVWNAVLHGRSNPTWEKLVDSRRGYASMTSGTQVEPNSSVPTYFANPFRAEGSGGLVAPAVAGVMQRQDIECTLLRSDTIDANDPANTARPLFADTNNNQKYNDYQQHPYFYTENLHRMSNLVGIRSNVFAIWITVGYFEIDENGLLGAELGSQTGEIERHRAFYIFDRSIPVAFEPGENHNVDRAVLVRRMIE
jgi:hypothetical protein